MMSKSGLFKRAGTLLLAGLFLSVSVIPTLAAFPEKSLSVSTSAQGGAWYAVGTRVLKEVERVQPGLVMQVQPGGSIINLLRLGQNKTNLAMTIDFITSLAYDGREPFEKPITNLRFLCRLFPAYLQIMVTQKSGVTTFKDMLKKRISAAEANSTTYLLFKMMLEAQGLTNADIRAGGGVMNHLGSGQAAQMMSDGNLDVWVLTGNPATHPKFSEVATTNDADLLRIEPEVLETIKAKYPFISLVPMPEVTYPGVKGGFMTIASDTVLVCTEDLSDEAAYTIVKSFFEHLDQMKTEMKQFNEMSFDKAVKGNTLPLHPGAERYYREKGLIQ
jgi:TRAP transporter TAXI family solute receptor